MNTFTIDYAADKSSTQIAKITKKYDENLKEEISVTHAEKSNYVLSYTPKDVQLFRSVTLPCKDNVYFIKCTMSDFIDEHEYICGAFVDLEKAYQKIVELQKNKLVENTFCDNIIFSILHCKVSCDEKVRIKSDLDLEDLKQICEKCTDEKPTQTQTNLFEMMPEVMSILADFFTK